MLKKSFKIYVGIILIGLLSMSSVFAVDVTDEVRDIINYYYVDNIPMEELEGKNIPEMFDLLDEHSVFYTEEEFNLFLESLSGEFVGIGVYIEELENGILINQVMENSPAQKGGLNDGDVIISVDGIDITEMPIEEGSSLIRGNIGTEVTLEVIRGEEVLEKTLIRDTIRISSVEPRVVKENGEYIGYIKINNFNDGAFNEFLEVVYLFYNNDVNKLILDVRDNPGGSLNEALNMLTLLVVDDDILYIDHNDGRDEFRSELEEPIFEEIVAIGNSRSASASEIILGALKDTGSATIIGETTYGKGTVQHIYPLENGEGFKLTTARFLTPSENVIDGVGITPDIYINPELSYIMDSIYGDYTLYRAFELIKK